MTKDFLIGFLAGILFVLVLFMMSPPSPTDKRRKQQPVRKQYADNVSSLGEVG